MIELLSPAGSLEKLKIAFMYGADAVYVGGYNYSLRANAKNFSYEELKSGVLFAHNLGKKVYVTVNIVLHNSELKDLKDYLLELESIGVDAVIVSDIAVINCINKNKINLAQINFSKNLGDEIDKEYYLHIVLTINNLLLLFTNKSHLGEIIHGC